MYLGKRREYINLNSKEILFADGTIAPYDIHISAVPLDKLVNHYMRGDVDEDIKEATSALRHSGGYMVGIVINQPCPSTKSWMYYPEDNCPFYRVTYLSNYSPYMTPNKDEYYSLL